MKFSMTKEWLQQKLAELEASGLEELEYVGPVPEQMVVAKMLCNTIEHSEIAHSPTPTPFKQSKVTLGAIYGNGGENKDFSDATPSGQCWMNISAGRPALEFFKPGESYYLYFVKAK